MSNYLNGKKPNKGFNLKLDKPVAYDAAQQIPSLAILQIAADVIAIFLNDNDVTAGIVTVYRKRKERLIRYLFSSSI